MDLRRGISMAVDDVVTNLKGMARMISTSEEIAQVFVEQVKKLENFLVCFVLTKAHVLTFFYKLKRWVLYLPMGKGRLVS
jgi:hypothetical protein